MARDQTNRWWAFGAAVVLVVTLVLTVWAAVDGGGRPHHVRLVLVGPPVVVVPLAEQVSAIAGHPVDATGAASRRSAIRALRDGGADAALLVDLAHTRDTLVLAPGTSRALAAAVTSENRTIEHRYGRTASVRSLRQDNRVVGNRAAAGPVRFAWWACLLGFAVVAAISLARGPFARNLRQAAMRLSALGVSGIVLGALARTGPLGGISRDPTGVGLVVLVCVCASGVVTLALEAFGGLAGLTVGAALVVVPAGAILQQRNLALLPQAYAAVIAQTPGGATARALGALAFHPSTATAPTVVLGAWLALGMVVLGAARLAARSEARAAGDRSRTAPVQHSRWRIQVTSLVVSLGVLVGVWVAFVPAGTPTPQAVADLATHTRCVYTGAVHGVAGLNRVTRIVRGSAGFEGGDVGEAVRLEDGRRLWFFGDTLRKQPGGGQQLVRNSLLVVRPGCIEAVIPDGGGAVIPNRADGVGYWPMAVAALHEPGYDLVSVATQRIRSTGSGIFDFSDLGPAIAVFVVPRGGTPQLVAQRDLGVDDASTTRPLWGAAATVSHGWLYLYGTARPAHETLGGFSVRVARVRPLDVLDQSAWRYWDGTRWTSDAAGAEQLIAATGGVSQTFSVFRRGRVWYAFSKRDEVLGHDLVFWTASRPTGPFTARPPVAQLPSDGADGTLRYMPLAHPDLFPTPGTVVISYSRNTSDFGRVLKNPLLYRPRFQRVRLP